MDMLSIIGDLTVKIYEHTAALRIAAEHAAALEREVARLQAENDGLRGNGAPSVSEAATVAD